MMSKIRITVACLLTLLLPFHFNVLAGEREMPNIPFYDWGACPFEGCSYGAWEVCATLILRKKPDKNAPAVLKIEKGESIQALTGVDCTAVTPEERLRQITG